MFKICRILLLSICLILVSNILYAQNHIVHGIVHTFDSIPLIGVQVTVKSTKQSVLTDSLGNFAVGCNTSDRLKIRADGFYTEDIKIKKNIKVVAVNLKLKSNKKNTKSKNTDQIYAIGYGHILEKDRTTAITNLNTSNATYLKYTDMYDLLASEFAGVQVSNGEIIIRGYKSFQGSSAALIVIDGVISNYDALNLLKPIEVKSINIIKDGSSAVYGSRGANGVVIIETKKGGD
jgi:TonB-dependent SusC/RagA subfamily outer membrane receptor